MSLRGLLLDVGGTLVNPVEYDRRRAVVDLLLHTNAASDAGHLEDAAMAVGAELTSAYESRCAGGMEYRQEWVIEGIVRRLGLVTDYDPAYLELRYWNQALRFEPEPGVRDALDAMRSRGLPVAAVSNAVFSARCLSYELSRHDLARYLDFVVSSADLGIRKPRTEVFLHAAARLGLDPEDIAFIGDLVETDGVGARDAGMQAFIYKSEVDPSWRRIANWATAHQELF